MGIRAIPASYTYTCDGCGTELVEKEKVRRPKYWATLIVALDAYDFQGMAVADGTVERLLCAACVTAVTAAINTALPRKDKC